MRQRWLGTAAAAVSALWLSALIPAAWAQERMIVQRGDALFFLDTDGKAAPRRLFAIGRPGETLWAASPDGNRIVWITRAGGKTGVSAATAHVAEISGRHEKKLFSADTLRDRLGRRVTRADAPTSSDGGENATLALDAWDLVSVAWSAEGRTLYVSCQTTTSPDTGKATFAADAASGFVLVDADGNWKSIAPMTYLNARDTILAGSGVGNASPPYAPILVVDLADGTRAPLYTPPASTSDPAPDWAFAAACVVSPDDRRIAFVASGNRGLWLVDRKTRVFRRLLDGEVACPHWSADGKSLFFLLPRPGTVKGEASGVVYDLYALTVPTGTVANSRPGTAILTPGPPVRLILQGVDAFDIVGNG